MISVFPLVQMNISDALSSPNVTTILQTTGLGLQCPNGVLSNSYAIMAPSSSGIVPAFPVGATTAVFIVVVAVTTTDLIVKTGSGLVALPAIPYGQAMVFYGLTNSQVSFNSVLGGVIQYAVGG